MPTTVTIEKLVFGGYGLARTDKGIMLVSDVVPGDVVSVEPCGKKGGCVIGRPALIISPSSSRRAAPCPLAGICGGCNWQHIIAEAQPIYKKDIFLDCMRRIGKVSDVPDFEVITSEETGYRHRAQIKIGKTGAGFFARGTKEIVSAKQCPLLVPALNDLLAGFSAEKFNLPALNTTVMAIAGDNDTVATSPALAGYTSDTVVITAGQRIFSVHATDFFQSNRLLIGKLGTWALPYVKGERCIDCFGGSGFFSIMLAEKFGRGLLIEASDDMATRAMTNFSNNSITNFKALRNTAENLGTVMRWFMPDVLIVDPPRTGLPSKTREAIAGALPACVLYISCDPSTQARDVNFLMTKAGYVIERAALFDLFPNTHHCESVLILRRS
jgi:23S rRNA (uracil1939-C5)-methyltransferase